MNFKAFILLFFLFACFSLSLGVNNFDANDEEKQVGEIKQGGRCRYGCCEWRGSYCGRCCRTVEEALNTENVNKFGESVNPVNDEKHRGRRGGGGHRGGGGGRCCSENANENEVEATPRNLNKEGEPNPVDDEKDGGGRGGRGRGGGKGGGGKGGGGRGKGGGGGGKGGGGGGKGGGGGGKGGGGGGKGGGGGGGGGEESLN